MVRSITRMPSASHQKSTAFSCSPEFKTQCDSLRGRSTSSFSRRMRRHLGDDAHGAAFRILEGEAIAAARLVELGRLLDLADVGLAHAVVDRVHRLFIGRGKIDAQQLALVALMQAEDVMLVAGAAQIDRALAARDRLQIPDLGIKPLRRLQIGDAEIDAPIPSTRCCAMCVSSSLIPRIGGLYPAPALVPRSPPPPQGGRERLL